MQVLNTIPILTLQHLANTCILVQFCHPLVAFFTYLIIFFKTFDSACVKII